MAEWVHIASVQDIEEGRPYLVALDDRDLTLYRIGTQVWVTDDACTHAEASLAEGHLEGCVIQCPRHGGAFDVKTGKPVRMPAVRPLTTYPVRINDNDVYVSLD